jgi:hypothetical protein
MQSKAATVTDYLAGLPEDRRAAISKVRSVIRKHLPKGFAERMTYGMIGYVVPHKAYAAGYHCDPEQPLPFAGLASQKNYMSLYLCSHMSPKVDERLRQGFKASGKRLDMGKSCIRFKKIEDLPLDVIGEAVGGISMADFITLYENGLKKMKSGKK